jgi:dipeptidyl aminopeptidase/acylaminoacyl peptidase
MSLRTLRFSAAIGLALASTGIVAPLASIAAQGNSPTIVAQGSARVDPRSKKALAVDDYSRWRTISGSTISSDGKWVAYALEHTNVPQSKTAPVLHVVRLDGGQDIEIPNATGAAFSADAKWVAYRVTPPAPARGGRGGAARGAAPDTATTPAHVELRRLADGSTQSWQDMQSFAFARTSTHLLLRRRAANGARGGRGRGGAPGGGAGGAGGSAPGAPDTGVETATPRGADAIVHDLTNGRDQLLGSVGDAAFNPSGELLAYTVDASPRDGNGLFVLEPSTGRVTPLDNDARTYNQLAWNDQGTGLAVLKGVEVPRDRERQNVLVVFPDVRHAIESPSAAGVALDPVKAAGFPKGFVVSDRATIDWSRDGRKVFFGIKEQVAAPDTARRRDADANADVDVWNSNDPRIQSVQMIRADADRNFTYREAFDIGAARFVKLADSTMRDVDVSEDGRWAVGRDTRAYISDYKPAAADLYRVNTSTGERALIAKNQLIGQHVLGFSPDGKQYLYWKDNKFQAYDLDAGTSKTLGGATKVSFVDTEDDHPGPRASFGIAGFTADGKGVIANHKYDLYLLPLDGSSPTNLTRGEGDKREIRFRVARVEPDTTIASGGSGGGAGGGFRGRGPRDARPIDLTKPVMLEAYGQWTKKDGFFVLRNGALDSLVYADASYSTPTKAANADVYLFTRQTFTEFPDLHVSKPTFADDRRISDANPQQAEYLWGHRMLVDFKDHDGHRLQALLTLPDDYKPGEKRPMLVNFYEKNSQNFNRYSAPSFLTGMGSSPMQAVSDGYITLVPDIYFHTGRSHSDELESVEAAVRKVIDMGYADPKHIGINGHSYGGEGAAFIGTRSRLFAAVGVGAGVSDLFSDFSQNWGWGYHVDGGSGANGNNYYLYGQGRWGFSPWEKPDVYMFESALTHVPEVTAPFLIEHGTSDPTVAFQNGLGLYNALRYNGKNAVLLAYRNEGHGLRNLGNKRDLTIRYFEFFDHYLKGAPAPKWMTEGVSYLQKEAGTADPKIVP